MTTENLSNPYAHENDSIELSVSEMKGQRATYLPVEVTVKMQGKYPVRDRDFNQVILEEVNGFWNPPHALSVGAKGIAVLSIKVEQEHFTMTFSHGNQLTVDNQ